MTDRSPSSAKRDTLNLRIKPEDRSMIERAAQVRGKTRTDFVLDAARAAAEEALLEQVVIRATPEVYSAFLTRLDAPAQSNERLRKTLRSKAPWDKA